MVKLISLLPPLFAGVFGIALTAPTQPAQPEQDRGAWHAAAPLPTKRTEVAAAMLEGKIYVVGGFEKPGLGNLLNFAITPSVEMYDPVTDRWTPKAPMPVGLHHVGIGVVDGRLYVIGGYSRSGLSVWNPVATVYAYDPVMDTWTARAPMPTARHGIGSAVVRGRIYVISGGPTPGGSFSDLNEVFTIPSTSLSMAE